MKNKKNIIILSIGAITLIIAVLGATYAYFIAQGGGSANTDVNVGTSTTDNLSFNTGSAINLNINQDNFGKDAGNQAGSTTASATLTANNATNSATANYYLYLNILNNNLEYTTEEQTAELVLTIKDPEGNPVTTLSGYNYVTVGDVSGFDITTKEGLIKLADNYEIVSIGTQTQEWEITITFINLDTDQNTNTGKRFSASLVIQQELIPTNLSDICSDGGNIVDCVIALYNAREEGENGLYYHDGTGSYENADQEAGDNSYRYSGSNPNNYVCFGSDDETCPDDNLYRIIGIFDGKVKLIKHDYAGSDLLGIDGDFYNASHSGTFGESSYYKGSKDQSTIPIYYWNYSNGSSSTNDWSTSRLNTVNLNTNYLNKIGSEWKDKIATTNWKVGGNTWANIATITGAKNVYTNEITTPAENTTYSAKIGLMYVSDYMYSASPTYWNYAGYSSSASSDYRAATDDNWMYMGLYEWTISRRSDDTDDAFRVNGTGYVGGRAYNGYGGVRPSFYLNSTVEFSDGTGTQSDPYRISL